MADEPYKNELDTIAANYKDTGSEKAQAACQDAIHKIHDELQNKPEEWKKMEAEIKTKTNNGVYVDHPNIFDSKEIKAGYKANDIPFIGKVEFYNSKDPHAHDEHKYASGWDPTGAASNLNKVSDASTKKKTSG